MVSGPKTLLWNFATAVVVVAGGFALVIMVRSNPPQTYEEFTNAVLLGVLWLVVLGVVLFAQLRS